MFLALTALAVGIAAGVTIAAMDGKKRDAEMLDLQDALANAKHMHNGIFRVFVALLYASGPQTIPDQIMRQASELQFICWRDEAGWHYQAYKGARPAEPPLNPEEAV